MARTVLGTSVMLFRTLGGSVVALANRCCHRSFPLVHGTVDGDTVVCGYHGWRYDTTGRCIEIPMQKSVPASLRVRGFHTAEKGPFGWTAMGGRPPAEDGAARRQARLDQPDQDDRD